MTDHAPDDFETHRGSLVGLAYRMLGSLAEAEDVVQDAYLRWHGADRAGIGNPRAYLSKVVTRLCLDRWKEARHRREIYVGPWLPEPLVEDPSLLAAAVEDAAEDVSFALMLALERLSPLERAAFLLHDVFDMGFSEIAAALGRSEAACRQLASRARSHVRAARPRFRVEPDEGARVAEAFFAASRRGDTAALQEVLAEAVTFDSDGGGRRVAALRRLTGAGRICRFFASLARRAGGAGPLWAKRCLINGLPGWVTLERDGLLQTTALEIADGKIAAIYVMRNPEKLGHLAGMVPEGAREALKETGCTAS